MKAALTNNQGCTYVAQETYTQTSKTIIQLAKAEQGMMDTNSLQTQTSRLLITEKQSKEVKIEVHCPRASVASDFLGNFKFQRKETIMPCHKITEFSPNAHKHEIEDILNIVDDFNDGSRDNSFTNTHSHSGCQLSDRDMDNDSLCDEHKEYPHVDAVSENSETPESARKDVEELYKKISEMDIFGVKRTDTNYIKPIAALTPLTEESIRKDSLNHLFGNNQNIIQNKLILKDKCMSDSILYNESIHCPNLISNFEELNENKIAENNNVESCLFNSQMCVKTADSSNGQIRKTSKIANDDNVKITPITASAMTTFPNSEQNSAITSRSCLTCFSTSDKLSDIYEEKGFGRHEKVLCQISSLFTKKHGKQQVSIEENTQHSKKSVAISVVGNQDSLKPKHNDNENNASQTSPKQSLDQDTQYDNKIIPSSYVNYAPSESSNGNDSYAHTINAEGIDINIKLLPDLRTRQNKLPQIEGKNNDKPVSCPNSSRVNVLLTVNASAKRPASKPEVLPHIRKGKVNNVDFSTVSSKILVQDGNNNESKFGG